MNILLYFIEGNSRGKDAEREHKSTDVTVEKELSRDRSRIAVATAGRQSIIGHVILDHVTVDFSGSGWGAGGDGGGDWEWGRGGWWWVFQGGTRTAGTTTMSAPSVLIACIAIRFANGVGGGTGRWCIGCTIRVMTVMLCYEMSKK